MRQLLLGLLFVTVLCLALGEEQPQSIVISRLLQGISADLDSLKENLAEQLRKARDVTPEPVDAWTGKWFPQSLSEATPAGDQSKGSMDPNNMYRMVNSTCDDGKQNLTVDWEPTSYDYTCEEHKLLDPDLTVKALLESEPIPPAYSARHHCMKDKLIYDEPLPTFGPHRPAWAKYGEYSYLPTPRYLHNMEHGAVVFLYHPCAQPSLIAKMKNIIKSCLYRHVITASRAVPLDRPFVLMSWGYRLSMPTVDTKAAVEFIREHALHGAEKTHKDGYYDQLLVAPAEVVSTPDDQELCPKYKNIN